MSTTETYADPREVCCALLDLAHADTTADACRLIVTFRDPHESQLFADIAGLVAEHLHQQVTGRADAEVLATLSAIAVEGAGAAELVTTGPDGGVPCPTCGFPVTITGRDASGVLATRPATTVLRCHACFDAEDAATMARLRAADAASRR